MIRELRHGVTQEESVAQQRRAVLHNVYAQRLFPFFVYANSAAFAALHSMNFEGTTYLPFWIKTLLVLPQLLGGMRCCYLRTRDGIGAAMMSHFLHNACCYVVPIVAASLRSCKS